MTHPARTETKVTLDSAEAAPESAPSADTSLEQTPPGRLYGGQYATVEELEAAYQALRTPGVSGADAAPGPAVIDGGRDADVADALSRAGLDMDEFNAEFSANGALSEASYARLGEAGFPKELVDVYVDGLKARIQSFEAAVYASVGGKEGYAALLQWAGSNVSDEHKRVYNEAIQSGDPDRATLAVQALIALRGGSGRLLSGKTATAASGIHPYQSQAQAVAAVQDPRYRRDPAYRAAHEARLAASSLFT